MQPDGYGAGEGFVGVDGRGATAVSKEHRVTCPRAAGAYLRGLSFPRAYTSDPPSWLAPNPNLDVVAIAQRCHSPVKSQPQPALDICCRFRVVVGVVGVVG